jgi:carboxylate-amine ligase
VTARTVGVEEEYLLVDPQSGHPRAVSHVALAAVGAGTGAAELTAELQREQLESATRPCATLAEVATELRRARAAAARAAHAAGAELAALATSPMAVEPTLSPSERYREMGRRFGLTVSEELTCGCHVHVGIDSDEEGVGALDRIRPWLAPLLALTANSPFWQGADSGYASYRCQVWQRWPSAGPYVPFGTSPAYHATVRAMVDTDTVLDPGMVYFDARLSAQHPTLEVRVGDVCLDVDDAVLLAALVRALVETAVRAWRAGVPADPVRLELLRLAAWRASRSGVDGVLLDPCSWRPMPAADVLGRLVTHVASALEEAGDLTEVRQRLGEVLRRGTGARAQRDAVRNTAADPRAAVTLAVRRTTA